MERLPIFPSTSLGHVFQRTNRDELGNKFITEILMDVTDVTNNV